MLSKGCCCSMVSVVFYGVPWYSVAFYGVPWYSVAAVLFTLQGASGMCLNAVVVFAWFSRWRSGERARFMWGQSTFWMREKR